MHPKLLFPLASLVLFLSPALAQDEFSVPGIDDPASVENSTPAPSPSPGDEDSDDNVAATGEQDLFDLIRQGGWAMWPLGAFSLAVIGLAVFCAIDISRRNFSPQELIDELREDAERGDFTAVMERSQRSSTCLGQVMFGATEYIGDRGYQVLDDSTVYDLMADASQEFNRGRARTINYFSILAQAAPMLGLLGTVSGMIGAFGVLSRGRGGDPSAFAGDISEALVTTASGLVIALPALFCYFFFRDRLTQLVAGCDRQAYRILNALRREAYASQHEGAHLPPPSHSTQSEPVTPSSSSSGEEDETPPEAPQPYRHSRHRD